MALAEQELNNQLKNHSLNKVSFSLGYTANMYLDSFLWASSDTPINHSPFSFAKIEPIRATKHKTRRLTLLIGL
jgi:hypothetical protein